MAPRLIAFHLTQFHPVRENDEWWGKGFTEWTNASRARPLFDGHYQPHLPGELGFYDLRVPETRRAQGRLAREYGVDAFCFHYYWFAGHRLLERPLLDMLEDEDDDMPFCVNWANESWTRRPDGVTRETLIAQRYSPKLHVAFMHDLAPVLRDRRYLRVDGRPVLLVYRAQEIPDCAAAVDIWRREARALGLGELHLVAVLTFGNTAFREYGFDAAVPFPPNSASVPNRAGGCPMPPGFRGKVYNFPDIADYFMSARYGAEGVYRCVFPSWDNTARRGNLARIVLNGTPANYEQWLARALDDTTRRHDGEHQLVFVNAWNEWAEGCHLEPDQRHGRAFLEATRRARQEQTVIGDYPDTALPRQKLSLRLLVRRLRRRLRQALRPLRG